jgi:P-type Cu2+ transporter
MLASAGRLARRGVLTCNLQALEAVANVDTVIFDKTGTLTGDTPELERVYCRQGMRPGDAVELAAALGAQSLHPAARALVAAWKRDFRCEPSWQLLQLTEYGGKGVEGRLRHACRKASAAEDFRFGSADFCGVPALDVDAAQVHLSDATGWLASFVLRERLRDDAKAAVRALQAQGIAVQLLSGDRPAAARAMASRAGIAIAQGDCRPEDKLREVRALEAAGRRVAMVGDGLNDGPVIAGASASFAFGNAVPLTRAKADFIVLGSALAAIPECIALGRRTLRVVRQNLWWAAGYNALCVPLALAGWLPAWLAGAGMAASSLFVVANAARLSATPRAN